MNFQEMLEKHRKTFSLISVLFFILFLLLITWLIGEPLVKFVSEPENFRLWVESRGLLSRLAFIGMVVIQVVVAIIPGEPFEIGAGYAFGALEGTVLSVIGITLGSAFVYLLVKKFGIRILRIFFDDKKISSIKFLQNKKRLFLITFLVFLIPGTPKDLLSYGVGLTDIKFSHWLFIASVARLPSLITSTLGGNALGEQNYKIAIIVFSATVIVSAISLLIYKKISSANEK